MAGSASGPPALRDLVARGDAASVLDAVQLALTMSVSQVRAQLDYDFLDEHADEASRFFDQWLPGLPGYERMAAADWVGAQHVLSMVHLDHAYGSGARTTVEALVEVTGATADSLEAFRLFTEGPDAQVPGSVADRLGRLAGAVRGVRDELADVLAGLPPRPGPAEG